MEKRPGEPRLVLSRVLRDAGWRARALRSPLGTPAEHLDARSSGEARLRLIVHRCPDSRPETVIGGFGLALAEAMRCRLSGLVSAEIPIGAVVEAPVVGAPTVERVHELARKLGEGIGWGVIDARGTAVLEVGPLRLERAAPRVRRGEAAEPAGRLKNPFTDLGQWIVKLLLKRSMRMTAEETSRWISGPARWFGSYEAFADAAGVSLKTAWDVVRSLDRAGFVAGAAADRPLMHLDRLLEWWHGAVRVAPPRPYRWLLPSGGDQLASALGSRARVEPYEWGTKVTWLRRRACLGGFSAARELGLSITPVVIPEIHVDGPDTLDELGLVPAPRPDDADVLVHVTRWREAVFRAAVVTPSGIPVADVVQTWHDVIDRPGRGREQADRIARLITGGT